MPVFVYNIEYTIEVEAEDIHEAESLVNEMPLVDYDGVRVVGDIDPVFYEAYDDDFHPMDLSDCYKQANDCTSDLDDCCTPDGLCESEQDGCCGHQAFDNPTPTTK